MHRQFLTEIATQIFKGAFIICILAYLLRPIHHHFAWLFLVTLFALIFLTLLILAIFFEFLTNDDE